MNVHFAAFNKNFQNTPQLLNIDNFASIASLKIKSSDKIFLIIHGFLELGNAPWLIEIKNELLKYDESATVMIVDWRGGSSPPYYQAVANIRLVGAIVAHFIMAVQLEFDLMNLDNFHLIGHSLGAHVAGYAGYFLQRDFDEKIGRITGQI